MTVEGRGGPIYSVLSADTKPTPIEPTALLVETDTGDFYVWDGAAWILIGGGASPTFLGLTDTPGSYVGQGLEYPRVNVGETALEFHDLLNVANTWAALQTFNAGIQFGASQAIKDAAGTPRIQIDTSSPHVTVTGTLAVVGVLAVAGIASITSTLDVSGLLTANASLKLAAGQAIKDSGGTDRYAPNVGSPQNVFAGDVTFDSRIGINTAIDALRMVALGGTTAVRYAVDIRPTFANVAHNFVIGLAGSPILTNWAGGWMNTGFFGLDFNIRSQHSTGTLPLQNAAKVEVRLEFTGSAAVIQAIGLQVRGKRSASQTSIDAQAILVSDSWAGLTPTDHIIGLDLENYGNAASKYVYGVRIQALTLGTIFNIGFYQRGISADGLGTSRRHNRFAADTVIGADINPLGALHVDQSSSSGAKPVAYFDQADVSEEMFEFNTTIGIGNAIEAIGAKILTTTHFIKVTIPGGLTRYIPAGTIA